MKRCRHSDQFTHHLLISYTPHPDFLYERWQCVGEGGGGLINFSTSTNVIPCLMQVIPHLLISRNVLLSNPQVSSTTSIRDTGFCYPENYDSCRITKSQWHVRDRYLPLIFHTQIYFFQNVGSKGLVSLEHSIQV